jgi:soluble P-type ATPase
MIIDIPSVGVFSIENIVFDFNGTLAKDGKVPPRVYRQILGLTQELDVYIITADTFETVKDIFDGTENSDLMIKNINDFFEMMKEPKKLIATLRK